MMERYTWPFADPETAPRLTGVLSAAAFAGVALLAARAVAPRRPGVARDVLLPAARDGYAYFLLALGLRLTVQHHKSRLQMLGLLVVVAAIEAARLRPGTGPRRGATWLAGSAAVCLGVVMAKWALEPGVLSETVRRLQTDQD